MTPYKTFYHVFTNNFDDYFSDEAEAINLYKELLAEYSTARIYQETYETAEAWEVGQPSEETYVMGEGEWPC